MRGPFQIRWVVFALNLFLSVQGCMVLEERRDGAMAVDAPACTANDDCAEGLICSPESGICVAEIDVAFLGYLRLVPPASGLLAIEEQYANLETETSQPLNLRLNRPVRVVGRVLNEGSPLLGSEDANIVAVADGAIPGIKLHQEARSVTGLWQADGENTVGFELWVTRDLVYDIYVHQSTDTELGLPPYHVRRSFSPAEATGDAFTVSWDIELPSLEHFVHVSGRVVLSGEEERPLPGAKVVAVSAESGDMSSTGTTDEDGWFDLLVQPPSSPVGESYSLLLRPSLLNETVPETVLDEILVTEDLDAGTYTVDGLSNLRTVTVMVMDASGAFILNDLQGTTVSLTGSTVNGDMDVEHSVDSVGTSEFSLPPGLYVLSVVPPEGSSMGIYQEIVTISDSQTKTALQVALEEKLLVHGWVMDASGSEVEGCRVVATFTGKGLYPETSPLPTRKADALTDRDGHYQLRLDPGQYTLHVEPPDGSGLPRLIQQNVFLANSQQRTLRLSNPVVVSGRVHGIAETSVDAALGSQDGAQASNSTPEPVAGVRIEFFDEIDDRVYLGTTTPVPMAVATTDEEGRYVLILPAD